MKDLFIINKNALVKRASVWSECIIRVSSLSGLSLLSKEMRADLSDIINVCLV